jgi:hypothetical protein
MSQFLSFLTKTLDVRPYEVELLSSRRRTIPLAWVLLGFGLLALAGVAGAGWPAWQQRAALSTAAATLEQRLAGLGMATAQGGNVARSSAGKADEAAALTEAGTVMAELHRPWHELFEQIEAADEAQAPAVHLLQLSVAPPFTNVQVIVEARDLGDLVRFSQRLSGGKPIENMTMTHHEGRDALGAHVVTATLQGHLLGGGTQPGGAAP